MGKETKRKQRQRWRRKERCKEKRKERQRRQIGRDWYGMLKVGKIK